MNNEECRHAIKHFITKFETIPEDRWCIGSLAINWRGVEMRCAIGHCYSGTVPETAESDAYSTRPKHPDVAALGELFENINGVWKINDGGNERYQQPSPKQRILAALRDLLAL